MRKNWNRQKIQEQDNAIARLQAAYDQASQALCDAQKLIEDLQEEKAQDALRLERMVHSNSRTSNFPSSMDICQREASTGNKPEDKEESDKKSDDISKSECSNSCIHPETIKRVPVSSRESSKNPRGGQSGHPSHISQLSDNLDSVQVITVKKAPSGAVPGVTAEGDPCFIVQRRGVKAQAVIEEFQYVESESALDLDADTRRQYSINPVCYSSSVKALCVYLHAYANIPYQRLCAVLHSLSGGTLDIRESTISLWMKEFHEKSSDAREQILDEILKEPVVHADETSLDINGVHCWLHVISGKERVWFTVTEKRGGKGERGPVQILKEKQYRGIVVHDHFASYLSLENVSHQECSVHLMRYFRNGVEFDHSRPAKRLIEMMNQTLTERDALLAKNINCISPQRYEEIKSSVICACQDGIREWEQIENQDPEKFRKYRPPYYRAMKRMIKYIDDHLRYLTDFSIPFGNNEAERQMAVGKMHKKVSRQHVSRSGADCYASALTLLQTAKKQEKDILKEFEKVFEQ